MGDKWKIVFNTQDGHYEYLMVPFDFSNAPNDFQYYIFANDGYSVDPEKDVAIPNWPLLVVLGLLSTS